VSKWRLVKVKKYYSCKYRSHELSKITPVSCSGMSKCRATGGLLILLLLQSSHVPAKETPVEKEDHKGNDVATSVLHDIHRYRRSTEFVDASSTGLHGGKEERAAANGDFKRERRSPGLLRDAIRDGYLPTVSSLMVEVTKN
jgi:hypothetical protein